MLVGRIFAVGFYGVDRKRKTQRNFVVVSAGTNATKRHQLEVNIPLIRLKLTLTMF